MNESINIPDPSTWPGILVGFNDKTDQFYVLSADTMCGYFVHRNDLVGDYRNSGEVLSKILDDIDITIDLLVEERASQEINVIWETNIVLFN